MKCEVIDSNGPCGGEIANGRCSYGHHEHLNCAGCGERFRYWTGMMPACAQPRCSRWAHDEMGRCVLGDGATSQILKKITENVRRCTENNE